MNDYDHTVPTIFTKEQCEAAVGEEAALLLTGKIVEAREGDAGPFVLFEVDERYGFDRLQIGLDLDLLMRSKPWRSETG